MDSDVPEGRCGFTLSPGDVGMEDRYEAEGDGWYERFRIATCCRETWNDTGRCIWHADSDEKSADEVVAARGEKPERLDGAMLRDLELGDVVSFEGCRMVGAVFDGVGLQNAEFPDADLQFTGSTTSLSTSYSSEIRDGIRGRLTNEKAVAFRLLIPEGIPIHRYNNPTRRGPTVGNLAY